MIKLTYFPAPQAETVATNIFRDGVEKLLLQNTPLLLLLSGGGNISLAKNALSPLEEKYGEKFSSQVTMMVLDERFTQDPQMNNSLLLQAAGLKVIPTIPKEHESLDEFGARFSELLRSWIDAHSNGKIVATLGMGADGHIAGISPLPNETETFFKLFVDTSHLAVGYTGNLEPKDRVTVTTTFLKRIHLFFGYISGEAKLEALRAFLNESTEPNLHPAQLLHKIKNEIVITTNLAP